MTRTMLVLTVALAATGVRVARATDVTLCGQKIARGDTGILRNDLVCGTTAEGLCAECDTPGCTVRGDIPCTTPADCTSLGGSPVCLGVAVHLGERATLEMDGFSISSVAPGQMGAGVFCDGHCKIRGPGDVSGAIGWGIRAYEARAFDVTLHDNYYGLSAQRSRLFNVMLTGNVIGAEAYTMTITGGAASDNSVGLVAYSVRGKDFAANDNGDGVDGEVVSLKRATVNGNGNYGVLALRKAALLDSTVTGSGHFDIGSFYRPRVVNTTCGTSVMILTPGSGGSTGDSWGVCAGD